MSQIVSDAFTRANSTGLGANWTNIGTGTTIDIVSNQAKANAGAGEGLTDFTGASWTGGADQYAEAAVIALESGRDIGPGVRVSGTTSANANAYIFDLNDSDAAIALGSSSFSVALYKQVAGTFTQIGSSVTGVTINANDVIRIEVQGTTVRGKINGVTIITGIDASLSSGNPGLYIGSGTASIWDNFAAGDFSGGAGGPVVDGPHGDQRPFPFLPSSPPQRM